MYVSRSGIKYPTGVDMPLNQNKPKQFLDVIIVYKRLLLLPEISAYKSI